MTLLCSSARLRFGTFLGFLLLCFVFFFLLFNLLVSAVCLCGRVHGVTAGRVGWESVVVVAVRAQDLTAVGEEAGAHQRDGAARTLEARLVPLPVLERNVFPVSETCRRHKTGGGQSGKRIGGGVENRLVAAQAPDYISSRQQT